MRKLFLKLSSKSLGIFYDLYLAGFAIIMLTEKIQVILTVIEALKGHPRNDNILIIIDGLHKAVLKAFSRYEPLDFYWG